MPLEQLQADIEARLLARIDAAEQAGRISSARAARLRERVSEGSCAMGGATCGHDLPYAA